MDPDRSRVKEMNMICQKAGGQRLSDKDVGPGDLILALISDMLNVDPLEPREAFCGGRPPHLEDIPIWLPVKDTWG